MEEVGDQRRLNSVTVKKILYSPSESKRFRAYRFSKNKFFTLFKAAL